MDRSQLDFLTGSFNRGYEDGDSCSFNLYLDFDLGRAELPNFAPDCNPKIGSG